VRLRGGRGTPARVRGSVERETESLGLQECGGGRWSGAGRAAEVGEDGLHGEGILHSSDDPQAAPTAGAGEEVEIEGRHVSATQVQ
jgi:hypothetical protein